MGTLIVGLIPLAIGILLSPLAVVAVIVVLVSPNGRVNSVAFLAGWLLGITLGVAVSYAILVRLDVHPRTAPPPTWVGVLHLLIASVLLGGAWWTYTRQHTRVRQLAAAQGPADVAAAVPTLPGWLQQVDTFTPVRTALLALALAVLNPVDLSCAVGAGLQFAVNPVATPAAITVGVGFVLVAGGTVIAPVIMLLAGGPKARPLLRRTRTWIAGHTGTVNALMFAVIGALQLSKAILIFI